MDSETDSSSILTRETTKKVNSKRLPMAITGLILALLLGGAAYMAGRYLNGGLTGQNAFLNQSSPFQPGGAIPAGSAGERVGIEGASMKLEIRPAEELPATPPDVSGVFVKRADNSIFVGTGNISFAITGNRDGGPTDASTSYDGPVVEVVVTNKTQVYQDITISPASDPPDSSTLQQKVAPGSVEEIGQNSSVTAWGKKVGDRVIAEVLVYSSPVIIQKAGE